MRCEPCVKYKKGQRYFAQNIFHLVLEKTLEREKEGERTRFSSAIHGVSSVGSRRA